MRCDRGEKSVCHRCNLERFHNATTGADVRLDDIDSTLDEILSEGIARVESLTGGDWNARIPTQSRHRIDRFWKHCLLEKEDAVRFNPLCHLHRVDRIQATVPINCDRNLVADCFAHRFDYCFDFFTVSKTEGGSRRIEWRKLQSTPTGFDAL